jgi:catechol 2,3-dioxygenase-like lactoylglutathione lyase family enzyme
VSLRPSHIGLCVSDLEQSLRFYCDGLGFELSDGYDLDSTVVVGLDAALEVPGPAVLRSQMIVLDGLKIELLHYTSPAVEGQPSSHRNQLGLTHLSFWVDDLDAAAERLVKCGGTILADTRQSPGVELVFLADPDGARVELMEQPE